MMSCGEGATKAGDTVPSVNRLSSLGTLECLRSCNDRVQTTAALQVHLHSHVCALVGR